MDETSKQPLVFANRIIKQIVQHTLAPDMIIEPKHYMAIRTVFRKMGGSWSNLASGDQTSVELLKSIITAWGLMPTREKESDRIV